MKKIIINADDFGINEIVTAEIERQIIERRVSSTTIMANGKCLDEVKRFASQHPEISFGVHLCLSEFDSMTKSEGLRKAGITDDEGKFIHKAVFRLNDYYNTSVRGAIQDELNAQIDILEALEIPISHADSHHHVHTIYPLKELFADVLHKRGITKIRLGCDFRTLRMRMHLQKWLWRKKLNRYYDGEFITTNDFYSFTDFSDTGFLMKDGETIELMCHPGHPDLKYKDEIRILENSSRPNDIKLISYNEL